MFATIYTDAKPEPVTKSKGQAKDPHFWDP